MRWSTTDRDDGRIVLARTGANWRELAKLIQSYVFLLNVVFLDLLFLTGFVDTNLF